MGLWAFLNHEVINKYCGKYSLWNLDFYLEFLLQKSSVLNTKFKKKEVLNE
jgi:hypothetical protein